MMAAIENGKSAIVLRGRRAGDRVIITKVEGSFAYVTLAGAKEGKERKISIRHLKPVA